MIICKEETPPLDSLVLTYVSAAEVCVSRFFVVVVCAQVFHSLVHLGVCVSGVLL